MVSENCKACRGTGECISIGFMPPYKCTRCQGTGTIHYFNANTQTTEPIKVETPIFTPQTITAPSSPSIVIESELVKRRGRPPKST